MLTNSLFDEESGNYEEPRYDEELGEDDESRSDNEFAVDKELRTLAVDHVTVQ